MAELSILNVLGAASGSQDASLPNQFVRFSQLALLYSGVSLKNHTHTASQITDFSAAVAAILGAYDFPNDVVLSPGGGIVEAVDGLRVDSGVVSFIGHSHVAADVTDFDTAIFATLQNQLVNTSSIHWGFNGSQWSGVVQVAPSGGLRLTQNGVDADFGTGTNQVARGDHTHALLHNPLTLAASNTLAMSLATQQLTAEVKLKTGGGIIYDGDGLKLDSGVINPVVETHDPVTVVNSIGLRLWISEDQVLSGLPVIDPSPGAGFGKLALNGAGLVVVLGDGADEAAAGDHGHTVATTSEDGFMSSADKLRLDGLAEGIVSVQTNAPFFREAPAIANEYLLGKYAWQTAVYLRNAKVTALAGLQNTVLELELNGTLTGRQVTLPSGVANSVVSVEQDLFDVPVTAGQSMRWKVISAAAPEDAHYQIGLTLAMVASGIEPVILYSGVLCHPAGGLVQTSEGVAVAHLLEESNYRFKNGQMQFWDQAAYDADNTKPWRALGCFNGQTIWSDPIAD
jgi:hypothetical protein